MRIILVATDVNRKNIVFVSDAGRALSLEEAIRLIQAQTLKSTYIVHGKYGEYVRSLPNIALKDNLDALSVSGRDIISYINQTKHAVSTSPISRYLERYLASLDEGEPFITPIGQEKVLVADVKERFVPHLSLITTVAKEFNIDRYLLGAILIDEIARMRPFEPIFDKLGATIVGLNVSVGIAQVKIDTANQLIKKGLYNPNSNDKKLHQRLRLAGALQSLLQFWVAQPVAQVGDDGRQLAIVCPSIALKRPFQPLEQCPVLIHNPWRARSRLTVPGARPAPPGRAGCAHVMPGVGGVPWMKVYALARLVHRGGYREHPLQPGRDHALEGGHLRS